MTDPPDTGPSGPSGPSDEPHDDELVSAYLDGEATAAEAARVESDPELAARVETFAEVSARMDEVPAPPSALVDDHVATALAAFDAGTTASGSDEDEAGDVVPLAGARHGGGSPSWWQRVPLGAAAAAVVVVVLAGLIGLVSVDNGSDDTATGTVDAADEPTGGARQEPSAESFGSDATASDVSRPVFADADALADHLRDRLEGSTRSDSEEAPAATGGASTADTAPSQDQGPAEADGSAGPDGSGDDESGGTTGSSGDEPDPCDAASVLGLEPAEVVLVVPVVVDHRPVTAVVHRSDDGHRLGVVDDATCTVTTARPL